MPRATFLLRVRVAHHSTHDGAHANGDKWILPPSGLKTSVADNIKLSVDFTYVCFQTRFCHQWSNLIKSDLGTQCVHFKRTKHYTAEVTMINYWFGNRTYTEKKWSSKKKQRTPGWGVVFLWVWYSFVHIFYTTIKSPPDPHRPPASP